MSIFNVLNTGIFSKLTGSTALITALGGTSIFYMQAPDSQALPYVVWSYMGGGPENISPGNLQSDLVYVRAYATASGQAGTIDNLCDAQLHRQAISVSGFVNIWTAREEDIALVENPPDGVKTYSAGGIYRVRVR